MILDVDQVWQDTLDVVRGELNTPTFKTWFEQTAPMGIVDHEMVVAVQNDFARDWLETRYTSLLTSALTQVTGSPMAVKFSVAGAPIVIEPVLEVVEAAPPALTDSVPPTTPRRGARQTEIELNPKCTFDSFVVGASNQFSYHVALAAAETPGSAYNPLFIYGGAGLGKTHLLQAIGSYVQTSYPHMKVKYVSSEQFVNDFINSIGDRDKSRMEGFRRSYRENDVLLIDDIQFIAGKEGTQTEFFHTFNTLREAGKQIVLSSDRPPAEIGDIEERLRTRFGWGLIADIQPPDLETRIAILRRKAEADNLVVPDDVFSLIADRFSNNIRELEGALLRVVAFSSVTRHPMSLDLAHSVLKDIFPERSIKPISMTTIQQEVCRFYGVSKNELIGDKRTQSIVFPRQIAMYLTRELTDLSLPAIGAGFGGRDHTTVIHANTKIQRLMKEQRDVYNQIQTLTNLIRQRT
ncbi:MAG: chromosomal replication initiator protein DnaA [Coriobacteriia bacterium]|nr:chromosomal replication initiator protein DnaA [Actinomycetota bacterium]MDZ4167495.1 chromosomal replication initiator protein DnaA [Coriobacteriia bacterium]